MRRRAITLVTGAVVLTALAQAAGAASGDEGPRCPAAGKGRLVYGGITDDGTPLYMRACGRARATFVVQGVKYRLRGGFCRLARISAPSGEAGWGLSVATGLVTNPPLAPIGKGLWLEIDAGVRVRPARVAVIDSVIELPGRRLAAHGEAVLRPRLAGGSFALVSRGDTAESGVGITGSWTCR